MDLAYLSPDASSLLCKEEQVVSSDDAGAWTSSYFPLQADFVVICWAS